MIQQINLYQNASTRDRHVLLDPYLLSIALTCLALAIVSGLGLNARDNNQDEIQRLRTEVIEAQARLEKLRGQYPNQQTDALLVRELQQAQSLYQNLTELQENLADNQSDRARGFSRYLSALAEQADNRVWLTGIRIDAETGDMSLQGSTLVPEQIPLLLQRLQNAVAFEGRHFAKLSIQQSQEMPEQVDFSVSSSLKAETEASDERRH